MYLCLTLGWLASGVLMLAGIRRACRRSHAPRIVRTDEEDVSC